MACESFVVLPAGDRRLMVGTMSVWHDTHNIKSVVHSRYESTIQDTSAPFVQRPTSSPVDIELSRCSHLRPNRPTPAARCPVH